MSFIKCRYALILILLLSASAFAGEEGEGGEGGKKDAKKEEKDAGREFTDKTTKMNALQVKILDAQRDFDKVVEEKDHEKDQVRVQGLLKEMVEISSRRNKDVEEFNQLKQQVDYQYPGKAAELNQKYETQEKKDVDEMTSAADLDDMLTRVKRVIERKFGPPELPKDKQTVIAPPPPPEEPKKLKLEK